MPTDENFEIAWDAISDDELFKGIMRDWVRNRNERIAAQRHADRVRGEGITHQFKYGRSMPTTPPTEMTTHESSEDPTAATDTDDSTPPDPPADEPTPKIEETKTEPPANEEKLRAEIPVPDEVKQATASEIVSKPPSKESKSPESVEQAMAREAESKPPRSNEEEMAAFAGDRAISDEEKASAWYPGKEASVINQKTGEKVTKEFILKDPFANPFHNPNFLETTNPEPRNQEYITPVIKSEPLQEQKPDIGFDVVEGDDLSLLPASLFAKNAPGGDDMSLLPSGWKTD